MANSARNKPGTQKNNKDANPLDNLVVTYEKNKKSINTATTIILLIILGFLGYMRLYKAPREEKAATAISFAQRYFQYDSLQKALEGDGQHYGFLRIERKYDGTKSANLCHYYAGICYLHMGNFKGAIEQLKEFDGKGTLVQYAAWGALGDAYMEVKNVKEGIEYYKKASSNKNDKALSPTYLYREAVAYEMNNQPDEAKKAYERLRDEYPQSTEARDVNKYLAHLGEVE